MIQAAKDAGATAVHPGYGFLSEDAGFATAVGTGAIVNVGVGGASANVTSLGLQPSGEIVVGGTFSERSGTLPPTHNNTKGLVRAYHARTGKLLWRFDTIPRPGEFGGDTWENGSWAINGNVGVWNQPTVDEELGLVYLPVETPSSDFYGGHRPGNNLFAESIVAVDLKTGKRKWHYQFIHHDIWDWDVPCAPILADVVIDGRLRKIVAQPTKQAWVYVFDRATGEPMWPIE